MVNPAWFYSTLAQSSAAIIGFIIAFTAVIHQLERQTRERRTQELREILSTFEEDYRIVLMDLQFLMIETFPPIEWSEIDDQVILTENIEEYEPALEFANTALSLYRKIESLDYSKNPREDYLLDSAELTELREEAQILHQLASNFEDDGLSNALVELSGFSDQDMNRAEILGIQEEFIDDDTNQPPGVASSVSGINSWLSKKRHTEFDGDSLDLRTVSRVTRELQKDASKIDSKSGNTLVGYEPEVKSVILTSVSLLLVGVFTPIIFLMTPPLDSGGFTRIQIFAFEVALLLISAGLSAKLIQDILNRIEITAS